MSFERLLSGPFFHWLRDGLTQKTVVLQQSFKYFVLPKDLKPYKKLQKIKKLLANFGSEDTV